MKAIIWDKSDISSITNQQHEMWFDIYNNDLFEDRGHDITLMHIDDIDKLYIKFKNEYLMYLNSLANDSDFQFYVLLEDEYGKFISQARVITRDNRYIIEGLETHRDFMKKGAATKLIHELERVAKSKGIKELYANSYNKNIPSIKTFKKCNYVEVESGLDNRICMKKDLR